MQNSVMFGIMLTVLNKKIVTAKYLAEKYEMSERTIMRYVDELCMSGVPLYTLRGQGGGITICDDYKLDKMFFNENELTRLITSMKSLPKDAHDKLNDLIIDKLQNLAIQKNDDRYLVKNDTLVIDAGSWTNPYQYRAKMEVLNKCITNQNTIKMQYIDRYECPSERDIDPYAICLKEGTWYVYAWCHTRQDFRLFKLVRIKNMQVLDQNFERKPSDVYEKLSGHFENLPLIEIEFEFSSTILSEIQEWLGYDAIFERGTQYVARATTYSGNFLMKKLLSFGSSIKLLSPESLKEDLLKEVNHLISKYN